MRSPLLAAVILACTVAPAAAQQPEKLTQSELRNQIIELCPAVMDDAVKEALGRRDATELARLIPIFKNCGEATKAAQNLADLPPTRVDYKTILGELQRGLAAESSLELTFSPECRPARLSLFGCTLEELPMAEVCSQQLSGALRTAQEAMKTLDTLQTEFPGVWLEGLTIRTSLTFGGQVDLGAEWVNHEGKPSQWEIMEAEIRRLVVGLLSMPDVALGRRLLRQTFPQDSDIGVMPPLWSPGLVLWQFLDALALAQADTKGTVRTVHPEAGFPGTPMTLRPGFSGGPVPLLATLVYQQGQARLESGRWQAPTIEVRLGDLGEEFAAALATALSEQPCMHEVQVDAQYGAVTVSFAVRCSGPYARLSSTRRKAIETELFQPWNDYAKKVAEQETKQVALPGEPSQGASQEADQESFPPFPEWVLCEEGKGCRVDKVILARYLGDLGRLGRSARVIPNYDREMGTYAGFKLVGVRPDSLYRAIGIRSGDIVLQVNGQELSTPAKALGIWDSLAGATQVKLALMRQGQPYEIVITIEEGLYKAK